MGVFSRGHRLRNKGSLGLRINHSSELVTPSRNALLHQRLNSERAIHPNSREMLLLTISSDSSRFPPVYTGIDMVVYKAQGMVNRDKGGDNSNALQYRPKDGGMTSVPVTRI
jgi:hypothetical protein